MTASTASQRIAEFVSEFDGGTLPTEVLHSASRAFLDTFAVAIAGRHEPASRLVLEYARQQGAAGERSGTVWATGERLPIELAALVNGTMGHVLDYDDLTSPLRAHLSVAMYPMLAALAQNNAATGRQVCTAYAVGFEVAYRLAEQMVSEHYARGWHSTSSVGVIGTTAAGAHLLGLSAEQTVNALGLAVAQASGSRENFGTMAKSFQAGHCGAVAARALALAELGFTASSAAIDGPSGFMQLYAQGQDITASLQRLGSEPLAALSIGADIKKYPLCYATHRVIDGLLDLRAEHGVSLADIVEVTIDTNRYGLEPLIYHRPSTGLQAKFSMEYAVAAALEDGFVRLSSFEDSQVLRPNIQEFFPKVHASDTAGPPLPRVAEITLRMNDGRTLSRRVEQLRGGVELPLTDDELCDKARDCFAFAGHPEAADAAIEAVFGWNDRSVASVVQQIKAVIAGSSGQC